MLLAIDPSLAETGYAILTVKNSVIDWKVKIWGSIRTKPADLEGKRLNFIYQAIEKIIIEHSPTALAIEIPFVGQNPKTAIKLGGVRGIILRVADVHKICVYEYTPTQIKAALGYGRASKEIIGKMVQKLTGFEGKNDNISDAIAVGICHIKAIKCNQMKIMKDAEKRLIERKGEIKNEGDIRKGAKFKEEDL